MENEPLTKQFGTVTQFLPKLRKNKRLSIRWGVEYYNHVKRAVFLLSPNPLVPSEPPLSIRQEDDDCQPLYECQPCRDCFHFPSSLEDHGSRRSWILGYWCHSCFFAKCSHVPRSQRPCIKCQDINGKRKSFLRAKGLKKGHKLGCIKIFYNQCKFFEHLKHHQTSYVDLGDLMLMPMPCDVGEEYYAQLEDLCADIMERMFLTRTHIMDWLRLQKLGSDWWKSFLKSSSEYRGNKLAEIFAATGLNRGSKRAASRYHRPQKSFTTRTVSPAEISPGSSSATHRSRSNTPSSISETIESVITQSTLEEPELLPKNRDPLNPPPLLASSNKTSKNVKGNDNPYTTADITFVDCGLATQNHPPDVAVMLPSKDSLKINPTRNTIISEIVTVVPSKSDDRQVTRMSKPPLILKNSRVHNIVRSKPSIARNGQRSMKAKISVKKFAHESLETPPVSLCQNSLTQLADRKVKGLRKLAPAPNLLIPNSSMPSMIDITRAIETSNKVVAQASLASFGSKILTVHGPRNSDLSKIISKLPPEVINGKKLVFVDQDSDQFTILPKIEEISSDLLPLKLQSETDETKTLKNLPIKSSDMSKKSSQSKVQKIHLDGKVIYKNGKQFIIRPAQKSIPESSVCKNLNNLKLPTIPKCSSLPTCLAKSGPIVTSYTSIATKSIDTGVNKISDPLPASLSSSRFSLTTYENPNQPDSRVQTKINGKDWEHVEKEIDSSISVGTPPIRNAKNSDAVECFSIQTDAAGRSFVDFSNTTGSSYNIQLAVNYKQQMLENFRYLGDGRKKQYMDHLMEINAELEKVTGAANDTIMSENLKAIKNLVNAFKKQPPCADEDRDIDEGASVDAVNKIFSDLKETKQPLSTCPTCNKSTATESQIFQFSKGKDQSLGCRGCNNYICPICNVFQGNMSRFEAHLKFHAKKEPFACPECFRKFSSFQRLEAHTWTTCFHHLVKRWFKCRICNVEGFQDMDAVTKHFILAHSRLKIVCPECGILLKSQSAFQKHREEDHPKATDLLKPVKLMVCDIGNCVVRLENYRAHMDHHTAVINMLYFKCFFCSFSVRSTRQTKEHIKSHLYSEHSEQLSKLISAESLHNVIPVSTNAEVMITDIVPIAPYDYLEANSDEQTVKDGLVHDVCSINFDHLELSEIATLEKTVNTSEHVITEYSSSPKIFDVRSVTPDSYAELGVGTKEQIDGMEKSDNKRSPSVSRSFVETPECHRNNSVHQAETDVDSKDIIRAEFATSGSVVESSESTKSDENNDAADCRRKINEGETDATQAKEPSPPIVNAVYALAPKAFEKSTFGSATVKYLPASVKVRPRKSLSGTKRTGKPSVVKLKNDCSEKTDVSETDNSKPGSDAKVSGVTTVGTNDSCEHEEKTADVLRCNIRKPPPLAKIPQRLLERSQVRVDTEEEEAHRDAQITTQRSPMKLKRKQKGRWRIALNGPIHNSEPINYRCHLCRELINTYWSALRGHFESKHSQDYNLSTLTPKLVRMSDEFISEGYKEAVGPKKRKSDGMVASSKRRRRWNPKKHFEQHPLGTGLCVQQESVEDGEGNFVCKKCDLQCNDITSLRRHIGTNHRIKDHYLVCLECGENFVVEPSLQMHLKAFHRIKNPSEYMAQNIEYVKKVTESMEDEGMTGTANQCHVCMAVFEDKLAIDKHLRVHGMAFLNRKRIEARNAARNPEKRIKIDKADASTSAAASRDDELDESNPNKIGSLNCDSNKSETKNTSS